jgi:steroid 5-alpha reductase family enzyme
MSPLAFVALDLTFIAFYQNLLLLAISTPAYILLLCSTIKDFPAMTTTDTVISRALVVILLLESLADQQQWAFQYAKKAYKETGKESEFFSKEDLERGFVVYGVWSFSRHPNFTCEQAIWLMVYQWGCWQTGTLYNWTGLGAAGYLAVFQASTILTESITAGKYKEYKEYQKLVSKFVPGLGVFRGAAGKPDVKKE